MKVIIRSILAAVLVIIASAIAASGVHRVYPLLSHDDAFAAIAWLLSAALLTTAAFRLTKFP